MSVAAFIFLICPYVNNVSVLKCYLCLPTSHATLPAPPPDGLVSYSMPDGDARGGDYNLRDLTYDGTRRGGWLAGGLGQLTDGETGHTNFRVDALGRGRGE